MTCPDSLPFKVTHVNLGLVSASRASGQQSDMFLLIVVSPLKTEYEFYFGAPSVGLIPLPQRIGCLKDSRRRQQSGGNWVIAKSKFVAKVWERFGKPWSSQAFSHWPMTNCLNSRQPGVNGGPWASPIRPSLNDAYRFGFTGFGTSGLPCLLWFNQRTTRSLDALSLLQRHLLATVLSPAYNPPNITMRSHQLRRYPEP